MKDYNYLKDEKNLKNSLKFGGKADSGSYDDKSCIELRADDYYYKRPVIDIRTITDPIKLLIKKEIELFYSCCPEYINPELFRNYLIIRDFLSIYGHYRPEPDGSFTNIYAEMVEAIDKMLEMIKEKDKKKYDEVLSELKKIERMYDLTLTPKYD